VIRLAKKAGWEYLLIDGVNVPTIAFARTLNRRNDITAERRHRLPARIGTLLGLLADLGYLGLNDVATGFRRPRGGQLTATQHAANRAARQPALPG